MKVNCCFVAAARLQVKERGTGFDNCFMGDMLKLIWWGSRQAVPIKGFELQFAENPGFGCSLMIHFGHESVGASCAGDFGTKADCRRTFSLAVRRVEINRCRWLRPAPWPLFAGIDPKSPGFRAPATRIEYGNRRIVGEQMVACEHVLAQPVMQRLQPSAGAADPSRQCRTAEINAVPGEDLRLPVEATAIGRSGASTWAIVPQARQAYFGRRMRVMRSCAGTQCSISLTLSLMAWSAPPQHLQIWPPTSSRASSRGRWSGQRLAPGRRLGSPFFRAGFHGRTALADARNIAVEVFQSERQLVGIEPLGAAPELRPLQLLDHQLEAFDFAVATLDAGRHGAQQMMQSTEDFAIMLDGFSPAKSQSVKTYIDAELLVIGETGTVCGWKAGRQLMLHKTEVKKITRELEKDMQLYLHDAIPIELVKERSSKLDTSKRELDRFLAETEEPPPQLHPQMANFYRMQVAELYEALQEETEAKRLKAGEVLRSLMKEIILTPENGALQIDVRGDLAG